MEGTVKVGISGRQRSHGVEEIQVKEKCSLKDEEGP